MQQDHLKKFLGDNYVYSTEQDKIARLEAMLEEALKLNSRNKKIRSFLSCCAHEFRVGIGKG
jgi:hypothetical protein